MSVISLKNVYYSYTQSSRAAICDLSFSVEEGEYIAVVGRNGSGKSTLARLMAGFIDADSGTIERREGFMPGIVFQQPKEQIVAGVCERDTAFGPQNLRLTQGEVELRTIECLSVVSMADKALSRTMELSLGQIQRLAFSGILALFPDLLVLDEVTAMLDPDARRELLEFIGQWNSKGHTIIHVTHDEDEALAAGRIVALDKGKVIFDGSPERFKAKTCDKIFFRTEIQPKLGNSAGGISLRVENLSFSYQDTEIFNGLSFTLKAGTLTALTGPSGCGKSTLFECLAGLKSATSGEILATCRPALALQESEASLFEPCAADDVAFGPLNRGVRGNKLVARVKEAMLLVGLDYAEFADRATFALSGGEKRKLSLAGVIALDSDIIIFDEPTSALDSESRILVMKTLRALAASGKTVLFSTHRLEEASVADQNLKWNEICHKQNEAPTLATGKAHDGNENLKVLEMIPNASMLSSIERTAKAFFAPPKIPNSPLRRLPPAAKFAVFLVLFTASISISPLWLCVVTLTLNSVYALLAKYPLAKSLVAFRKLVPFVLLFAFVEMFFFPTPEEDVIYAELGILVVSRYKLAFLAKSLVRIACCLISIGTFIFSTDERQLMDGMSALLRPLVLLKIPVRYAVLVVGIIFRFMPLLMEELLGILKTQIIRGAFAKARGLKKFRLLASLTVPLVLQTFHKAQNLADALTARYFY